MLGQRWRGSYSRVRHPLLGLSSARISRPQVGAREQVVARVPGVIPSWALKGTQDPRATLCRRVLGTVLPQRVGHSLAPPVHAAGYRGCQFLSAAQRLAGVRRRKEKERRGCPMVGLVLGILGLIAVIPLPAQIIYVFTRGWPFARAPLIRLSLPCDAPRRARPWKAHQYPAPAGMITVGSFSSPSGNITCWVTGGVSCGIKNPAGPRRVRVLLRQPRVGV